MSKLILIGLATAALGIGGIVLPSPEKSTDVSSKVASANFVATASATQSVAAVAAVVSPIAGPFERSADLCATGRYSCITLRHSGDGTNRIVTVSEMIPGLHSWDRVKMLNGWSDTEVTLDTAVPRGATFAFDQMSEERRRRLEALYSQS